MSYFCSNLKYIVINICRNIKWIKQNKFTYARFPQVRTVTKEATMDFGRVSRTRIYRRKARPVTVPSFGRIRSTWLAARASIVPRWYTCMIITAMFGRHLTSRAECRYRDTRTRAYCSATRYSCTVALCRTPPWPTRSGRSMCLPRSGRTLLYTMIATTKRYVAH